MPPQLCFAKPGLDVCYYQAMNIYIFLGGPGSGKGTQADLLSEKLSIPHISTGQLFRQEMENKTDLGFKIHSFMESGDLVPDDIVMETLLKRLKTPDCANGAILDGVPRTLEQAHKIAGLGFNIKSVFYISIDETELIKRISGRRTCKQEGHIFHIEFNPPKKEGACDFDNSPLYQREEDSEAVLKTRLEIYHKLTEPLVRFYTDTGVLAKINGNPSIEDIHKEILTFLSLPL